MGADRDSHFLDLAEKAVAEELADTSKTKAEIWTAMGDYLEVHGVPANLVRQSVQDAIEKRLREKLGYKVSIYTSHFHNTMKAGGWPPEEDEPEINPEPKAIFTSVNQDFCDALDTVAAHAKFMRDVASTLQRPDGTFLRMTDVIPRKVYDTFVVQTTEMARVAKDYANQKSEGAPHTAPDLQGDAEDEHRTLAGGQGIPAGAHGDAVQRDQMDHHEAGRQDRGHDGAEHAAAVPAPVQRRGHIHGVVRVVLPGVQVVAGSRSP